MIQNGQSEIDAKFTCMKGKIFQRPNYFQLLFTAVVLFSLFIRVHQLVQYPEGFDQTEASFGYNAYSVAKTGRDEDGNLFPLQLRTVGDYKLAGYMYWQVPFVLALGLNEFAVRSSTAFAGILSLILLYLITFKLTQHKKVALLTFFITSISPWHLILSRMAYDPMIALMELLAALWFFLKWTEDKRYRYLFFCMTCIALALFTYYAVWVIFPFLFLLVCLQMYRSVGLSRASLLNYSSLLLPIGMLVLLLLVTKGARLGQDSTFQTNAIPLLEEQIREDQGQFPLSITRFFHNKLVFYSLAVMTQFARNLSMDFLFLRGDLIDGRFSVQYHGVLYLSFLPFLIIGLVHLVKTCTLQFSFIFTSTVVLVFLGSSFSDMGSVIQRTLFAAPLFGWLVGKGMIVSLTTLRQHFPRSAFYVHGIFALMVAINVSYFAHQYLWHANVHQPWGRDFGMREMFEEVAKRAPQYETVVLPDNSYMFYYFYYKVDPREAWEESQYRHKDANYLGLPQRSKLGPYVTMPFECPRQGKKGVLYVCRGFQIPETAKIVHIIRYRDQQPAFIFIEITSEKHMKVPPVHIRFFPDSSELIPESENRYY